jgi:TatD DNase family protein
MSKPAYIDTHCHLNLVDAFESTAAVLKRARLAGVAQMVVIGIDIPTSRLAVQLAEKHENLYATVGIHPNDCLKAPKDWEREILNLLDHPKVVAVGETGLDNYWKDTPPEVQKRFFRDHLDLALASGLPAIIHNREADESILEVVLEHGNQRGVFHCWPGDWNLAKPLLDKGYHISFTGNITFKKSEVIQDVAARMPLGRLMLETDSPFLTPAPHRGTKPNEPHYLPFIAQRIAELRGIDVADLAAATTANAVEFFGLKRD